MTVRSTLLASVALAGGLTASLTAQGPFIPPDSLITVHVDGPAKLRSDFAGTNFARMLASSRVRSLTGPLHGMIQMGTRQVERETEADVEGLLDELNNYKGRISIAFNLLTDNPDFNRPPPGGGVLVMEGDGETHLPTIADAIATIIDERAGQMVSPIEAGGLSLKMVGEDGAGMTVPQIIDDRLVVFVGLPLKDTIEHYAAHRENQAAQRTGSFAIHVDGKKGMDLVRAGIRNADDDEQEAEAALAMLDAFGLGNLAAFDMSVSPLDARIAADAKVAFSGPITGYFQLYVPDAPGRPEILSRSPTDRDMWTVQTLRFDKMLPFVREVMLAMEPQIPITYEEMERRFNEEFDLDLDKDLAAHLGDRMIIAADAAVLPPMIAEDAPDHMCVAFTTKDAAALKKTVQTMLEKGGLPIEPEQRDGLDIFTLSEDDAHVEWAFAGDLVAIGMGDSGARMLRQLLAGDKVTMPEPIEARLKLGPDGWDSASSVKLAPFIEHILEAIKQEEDIPPVAERYAQMFVGLLGDFDLEYVVSATRAGGSTFVQRMIW